VDPGNELAEFVFPADHTVLWEPVQTAAEK
jgi:hypothetical protein